MNMMETAAQAQDMTATGTVPEWVHILPLGQIEGRDGRRFELSNPNVVVDSFAANGADLPVDYEHQAENPVAKAAGPIPAAGWIKGIKATAHGVFAKIEWTEKARAMIAAKEYRYISPVILYDRATKAIGGISGAGLVHRPNLHLSALSSQDTPAATPVPDQTKAVADMLDMLGLTAEATATEVILALLAKTAKAPAAAALPTQSAAAMATAFATPDPTRYVELSAVQSVLDRATQERAQVTIDRIAGKISKAISEGFITPGMRKWAESLCSQSEAIFDDFCEKSGPTFAYLMRPAGIAGAAMIGTSHPASDPMAEAICAQLGLKPGTLQA